MILFVILLVLNIIFYVSDENYEVKKFEDLNLATLSNLASLRVGYPTLKIFDLSFSL